mgnify:CR=1 FL=1
MNLKKLAVMVIVISLGLFVIAFIYGVPIAYVPYEATITEFVLYHVIYIVAEVSVLLFLFMMMIKKSKLELYGDISKLLT